MPQGDFYGWKIDKQFWVGKTTEISFLVKNYYSTHHIGTNRFEQLFTNRRSDKRHMDERRKNSQSRNL